MLNACICFYAESASQQSQSAISPERMLAIQYNNYFLMNETNIDNETYKNIYIPIIHLQGRTSGTQGRKTHKKL